MVNNQNYIEKKPDTMINSFLTRVSNTFDGERIVSYINGAKTTR